MGTLADWCLSLPEALVVVVIVIKSQPVGSARGENTNFKILFIYILHKFRCFHFCFGKHCVVEPRRNYHIVFFIKTIFGTALHNRSLGLRAYHRFRNTKNSRSTQHFFHSHLLCLSYSLFGEIDTFYAFSVSFALAPISVGYNLIWLALLPRVSRWRWTHMMRRHTDHSTSQLELTRLAQSVYHKNRRVISF